MSAATRPDGLAMARAVRDTVMQNAAANEAPTRREGSRAGGLHQVTVVEASTEKALQYITSGVPVIFDPPRAGLHPKVVEAVLAALPPRIIYLSCNPATHARDLARLQTDYDIEHFQIFNFFPRTPHIETLAVLTLKR